MSTRLTARRTLTERVAEEIRVVMARRLIRQSDLARTLDTNDQWLSVRLRGRQPIDLNDLERIAAALDVDVADLIPAADSTGRAARKSVLVRNDRPAGRTYTATRPPSVSGPVRPDAPTRPQTPAHRRRVAPQNVVPGRRPVLNRTRYAA